MSPAVRGHWCTTCGEYVRPGTHGIHRMTFTAGAGRESDAEPETSGAAAVALVVLAIAGTGAALLAGAMLLSRGK